MAGQDSVVVAESCELHCPDYQQQQISETMLGILAGKSNSDFGSRKSPLKIDIEVLFCIFKWHLQLCFCLHRVTPGMHVMSADLSLLGTWRFGLNWLLKCKWEYWA